MPLENIQQKSGILLWNEQNLRNAPNDPGVFVLRSSPINGAIVYIGIAKNLNEILWPYFEEERYPNVKFFDWYKTNTIEEAELIKEELEAKNR